jgi:hypothetical protein
MLCCFMPSAHRWAAAAALITLAACGGGTDTGTGSGSTYQAGVYAPSSTFANHCASPRTGTDPTTGRAYPDVKGTTVDENMFLRSWTNELYLWYREVPDVNPASYATADYFNLLKTSATTPSGNPKDKFHFTYATDQWVALSQSGVSAGYGAEWSVISSRPPRRVVVAYTEPGSPATTPPADLARGAQVLAVDGVDLVNASDTTSVNTLNAGLYPSTAGASHTFSVLDLGAAQPRTITMVSANVTSTPVQNVRTVRTAAGRVGYMLFNDHIATAEQLLVSAFNQLAAAGVGNLVLDIRYNGGGYLDLASEVAYMIAGSAATSGRTFEKTIFNERYPTTDPVTGQPLTPMPFHTTTQGFSGPSNQPLPTLNLPRVTVLTSANTCSASESIINSLRGVGVQVIEVGNTTCGVRRLISGQLRTMYFSIQFQGVKHRSDYWILPANATSTVGVPVPGCAVADDFTHALGDPNEARFAAAVGYLVDQGCPAVSAAAAGPTAARALSATDGLLQRSPWRENRIYRRR